MNEVYGPLYAATAAEAVTPEMAAERSKALSGVPSDVPRDWFLTNEMKADARRLRGEQRAALGSTSTSGGPTSRPTASRR